MGHSNMEKAEKMVVIEAVVLIATILAVYLGLLPAYILPLISVIFFIYGFVVLKSWEKLMKLLKDIWRSYGEYYQKYGAFHPEYIGT